MTTGTMAPLLGQVTQWGKVRVALLRSRLVGDIIAGRCVITGDNELFVPSHVGPAPLAPHRPAASRLLNTQLHSWGAQLKAARF